MARMIVEGPAHKLASIKGRFRSLGVTFADLDEADAMEGIVIDPPPPPAPPPPVETPKKGKGKK